MGLATTHLGSGRCCKDFVMFSWNVTHIQLRKICSWPCKISTNIHPSLLLQAFFSYHPVNVTFLGDGDFRDPNSKIGMVTSN